MTGGRCDPHHHIHAVERVARSDEAAGYRDGLVNVATLLGTIGEPTDVAPNSGFVPSDDTVLLLGGGRFRVDVTWTDFGGGSGPGRVVPLQGSESGLFYFFQPANWEMLVKVLDFCAINQHFWVFFAATTNVEFRLQVVDTLNGQARQYMNSLGQAADAVTDTTAFATCT